MRRECPIKRVAALEVSGAGRADGLSALSRKDRKRGLVLKRGARLEVRITMAGAIGQTVAYAVKPDRFPKPKQLCLPPGASAPVDC